MIRPLVPATKFHADALAVLHARAFPPGERWGSDAMALQLGLPGVFGWIAEPGGMILARVVADESELLTLAVDPGQRRRGLGTALLAQAMRTVADRGARTMFLEVSARNGPARALYAGCGFEQVGRRPGYYRDGSDALVLRAAIACGSAAP